MAGKRKKKHKQPKASEPPPQPQDAKSLQEQLAAAEAEAARLRQLVTEKSGKRQKTAKIAQAPEAISKGEASEGKGLEEERTLNHKERKRLQRAAYKSAKRDQLKKEKAALRKAKKRDGKQMLDEASALLKEAEEEAACQANGSAETDVDMSAWKFFELQPMIVDALRDLGFTNPTPIQQECLPSAIRDRRDVIGAAQTVSLFLQMQTRPPAEEMAYIMTIFQYIPSSTHALAEKQDLADKREDGIP